MKITLKRGTVYSLIRKASRDLDLRFLGAQERSSAESWLLFHLGKRASARKGKATAPRMIKGEWYELRTSKQTHQLKLLEQFGGPDGRYLLFTKGSLRLPAAIRKRKRKRKVLVAPIVDGRLDKSRTRVELRD